MESMTTRMHPNKARDLDSDLFTVFHCSCRSAEQLLSRIPNLESKCSGCV